MLFSKLREYPIQIISINHLNSTQVCAYQPGEDVFNIYHVCRISINYPLYYPYGGVKHLIISGRIARFSLATILFYLLEMRIVIKRVHYMFKNFLLFSLKPKDWNQDFWAVFQSSFISFIL